MCVYVGLCPLHHSSVTCVSNQKPKQDSKFPDLIVVTAHDLQRFVSLRFFCFCDHDIAGSVDEVAVYGRERGGTWMGSPDGNEISW